MIDRRVWQIVGTMAAKIDELRLEHATALVKRRTAEIELRARWIQLLAGLVALATAAVSILVALLLVIRG